MTCPLLLEAQTITPQGSNYPIIDPLLGDQVFPHVAIGTDGGFMVWQDNAIDGSGLGIAGRRLDANLSGSFGMFRINQTAAGDQERPQILALADKRYAVVWQGGRLGSQNIYIRFLTSLGIFDGTELRVNSYTKSQQSSPRLAQLLDGNIVVVWCSLHEDGHLSGVFARVLDPHGQPVTATVQVNEYSNNNQRDPAVVGLTNGNFAVVWASENQRVPAADVFSGTNHVDLYGRILGPVATPVTPEFKVNAAGIVTGHPAVALNNIGGFTVAFGRKSAKPAGWDVYARNVTEAGATNGAEVRVNTYLNGDQYHPLINTIGGNQFVVWSSLGQDGSMEGVYGRVLVNGSPTGAEVLVNQITSSRQMHPALAGDKNDRFLVLWAHDAAERSFDILAQRYTTTQLLPAMSPPWLSVLSQSRIMVSWPEQSGFAVLKYQLFIDGGSPINVMTNVYILDGSTPDTSHSFSVGYVLQNGQVSPASGITAIRTWAEDRNNDGLPDDWQAIYWGHKSSEWAPPNEDSDGDGASNRNEFMAGTDPLDPLSVLVLRISRTGQGKVLRWNTMPGSVYQVQTANDFRTWTDLGPVRLAAGTTDSMLVPAAQGAGYYRVLRRR